MAMYQFDAYSVLASQVKIMESNDCVLVNI